MYHVSFSTALCYTVFFLYYVYCLVYLFDISCLECPLVQPICMSVLIVYYVCCLCKYFYMFVCLFILGLPKYLFVLMTKCVCMTNERSPAWWHLTVRRLIPGLLNPGSLLLIAEGINIFLNRKNEIKITYPKNIHFNSKTT